MAGEEGGRGRSIRVTEGRPFDLLGNLTAVAVVPENEEQGFCFELGCHFQAGGAGDLCIYSVGDEDSSRAVRDALHWMKLNFVRLIDVLHRLGIHLSPLNVNDPNDMNFDFTCHIGSMNVKKEGASVSGGGT